MKDLTIEEYYKSLTTAEWDMAEAIEKELEKVMVAGMTEETAIKFVRTTMAVRKAIPGATVCGVFSIALGAGLSWLEVRMRSYKPAGIKSKKSNSNIQTRKNKLSGKGTK